MAQVNISTRIRYETHIDLQAFKELSKKSIADIVDTAIKEYLERSKQPDQIWNDI